MKKQIFLALASSIFVFAGSNPYTFDMVPEYEKADNTKVSGSIGAYYESYSGKKSYIIFIFNDCKSTMFCTCTSYLIL